MSETRHQTAKQLVDAFLQYWSNGVRYGEVERFDRTEKIAIELFAKWLVETAQYKVE